MNKREAQFLNDTVVDALAEIRENKGISVYRIAKDLGISHSSVLYIENHKQKPTLFFLMMIANYLEADLGEIISKVMKN